MSVTKKVFGTDKNSGKTIFQYSIKNKYGMKAEIINFGAILTHLWVPDAEGVLADVTLGHDELEPYYENAGCLGATVGPSANRIGGAAFVIDGVKYKIPVNEGENNLHSDNIQGYQKRVFEAEEGENAVTFFLTDVDGCMGFPGNKLMKVTYSLSDENELRLEYQASSDKKTVLNPTNHSYFNLCGQGSGTIEDHILWLKASHYTVTARGSIPTGEILPVSGTPMDFTTAKTIGKEIDTDYAQLKLTSGYDQNWVVDDFDGQLQLIAEVCAPGTTRQMKVFTTLPGVQFYAGNFLDDQKGKQEAEYHKRYGLALETQYFPDSVNKTNFPDVVFGPDRKYVSTTIYAFSNQ